ncbi:MAG TPA: AbrB/MazE/SpoVT family DNA-binding domain-containing protein [Nitrososphaerales archaeon]|nr:AbrB/MazE/SpoVT family DNA-binding domain-containing protein [Nitrososphaerales archaeon]
MRIKVKLGDKGQIVIPKVARESIGLKERGGALLEVKEDVIEIRPLPSEDLVQRSKERAKKYGGDVKKLHWVYGDKLYEEVFSSR